MLSLHRSKRLLFEQEGLLKKRKCENEDDNADSENSRNVKPSHRNHQLPLEWQRCLDIRSGEMYLYNTRTRTRAAMDPRWISNDEPCSRSSSWCNPAAPIMSLDLQLTPPSTPAQGSASKGCGSMNRSPPWLSTLEGDQQEMVTAVCGRCYMLVMMSKSSPSCPNCKYMHPT